MFLLIIRCGGQDIGNFANTLAARRSSKRPSLPLDVVFQIDVHRLVETLFPKIDGEVLPRLPVAGKRYCIGAAFAQCHTTDSQPSAATSSSASGNEPSATGHLGTQESYFPVSKLTTRDAPSDTLSLCFFSFFSLLEALTLPLIAFYSPFFLHLIPLFLFRTD